MITPGKQRCEACHGDGGRWDSSAAWSRCVVCDGLGHTWRPGGPLFGCTIVLADRDPGEVVELGTGDRARIMWQSPRKDPSVTFVAVFDDFTESYGEPTPVDSRIGVRSVAAKITRVDLHDKEKDADLVDPIARRQRETAALV
jgi:hypothetical protein